ncbi:GAP1-N1 domain-containing protein [Aureispira anguillae]|uniref:Effector-associated domain EAD1-containing protein n=1 Tax=Aureispira anguillae TaxID=2864201 RepID=A0A915YFY9_9BACT|nr:effector-associated domain EAD1-containing protein [Aureispira anguillae]BDS12398.1 effector-associated domain EAD1-containing protein [Aureispira anguillae]
MSIITIHQSLCGEYNKAWGSLKTTLVDLFLADSIAFKADLPDQTGNVPLNPTIRGFLQGDFFLLMKTFSDESLEVRPGRKFSHVLIIQKKDIELIYDISLLFKYLPNEINKNLVIKPIQLDLNEVESKIVFPESLNLRFNKVINGYNNLSNYQNTIIWVGKENFEMAVSRFWKILTIEDKYNLNFGINFNSDAISIDKINFITIPKNIESKFLRKDFCVVRIHDAYTLTGVLEKLLAGDEGIKRKIRLFKNAIGIPFFNREDINTVAVILSTFENYLEETDLKKLNTLSQVVAKYSPSKEKGVEFKKKLVEAICLLLKKGNSSSLLIIKHFKINSFNESEEALKVSIKKWLQNNLFSVSETKKNNFSKIIKHLQESELDWWGEFVYKSISEFLSKITLDHARVILHWLESDVEIFKDLLGKVENSESSEDFFIKAVSSNITESVLSEFILFSRERKWYKFHAKMLLIQHSPKEALLQQIVYEEKTSIKGLELILKKMKPQEILEFTINNKDDRLIRISGKLCFESPNLLEKIEFNNSIWREIWLYSIGIGNSIDDGFKNPKEKIFDLFDFLISLDSMKPTLVNIIKESKYINLLDYTKRETFLEKLPHYERSKFLRETAIGWFEALNANPSLKFPDDGLLLEYIKKIGVKEYLKNNTKNISIVLPLFKKFPFILKDKLVSYLEDYKYNLNSIDAIDLGEFIKRTKNKKAAYVVYKKLRKNSLSLNNNWRYVITECAELLDMWYYYSLVYLNLLNPISMDENEWWKATEEVFTMLYPTPLKLSTLWKKAGGDEADLLISGTTRDAWEDALTNLKNKKYPNITIESLLEQMKKDYKNNDKVNIINNLRKEYL